MTSTAPVTLSWAGRGGAGRARPGRCGAGPGEECISGGRRVAGGGSQHSRAGGASGGGGRGQRREKAEKQKRAVAAKTCGLTNQMHQAISNYSQALVSV